MGLFALIRVLTFTHTFAFNDASRDYYDARGKIRTTASAAMPSSRPR